MHYSVKYASKNATKPVFVAGASAVSSNGWLSPGHQFSILWCVRLCLLMEDPRGAEQLPHPVGSSCGVCSDNPGVLGDPPREWEQGHAGHVAATPGVQVAPPGTPVASKHGARPRLPFAPLVTPIHQGQPVAVSHCCWLSCCVDGWEPGQQAAKAGRPATGIPSWAVSLRASTSPAGHLPGSRAPTVGRAGVRTVQVRGGLGTQGRRPEVC